MARQHRRLSKGEQASYDDEGYRVRARQIGWIRRTAFGVVFVALYMAMMALEVYDREDTRQVQARKSAPSFAWTNPVTERTTDVQPAWRHSTETTQDGMVLHQFTQYSEHAIVIMSSEDLGSMTLSQYASAWTGQLAEEWQIPGGYFEQFRGHPSWSATGEQPGGLLRIRVRLVKVAGTVWRVMTIQSPPFDYTDGLSKELDEQLWDTVAPRPGTRPAPHRVEGHGSAT